MKKQFIAFLLFLSCLNFIPEACAQQTIIDFYGTVKSGGRIVQEFLVDPCQKITVQPTGQTLMNQGAEMRLTLIDPKGKTIDFFKPGDYPGAKIISHPNVANIIYFTPGQNLTIENPTPGRWQAVIESLKVSKWGQSYSVTISSEGAGYTMDILNEMDEFGPERTLPLRVAVKKNGQPVIGADVWAEYNYNIDKPAASLKLSDHGEKGDDPKNDGVYTAIIPYLGSPGVYKVHVTDHKNFQRQGTAEFHFSATGNVFSGGVGFTNPWNTGVFPNASRSNIFQRQETTR